MSSAGLPDWSSGVYTEILNAYLATRAVVENATISQTLTDAYETLLNWLCLHLGIKTIFIGNLSFGTEATDQSQLDASEQIASGTGWTLHSTFTIPIDLYLYVAIKEIEWAGQGLTAGFPASVNYNYKITVQRGSGTEDTFLTGNDTVTDWTTRTFPISPTVKRQTDELVTIRFYFQRVSGATILTTRNRKVTYDLLLPGLDYELLVYAYKDGLSYVHASASVAGSVTARQIINDPYAQLKVRLKCSLSGMKVSSRIDNIGLSL